MDWSKGFGGGVELEMHAFGKRDLISGIHTLRLVDFSPDAQRLAVVAARTDLTIYDLATGHSVGSVNMDETPLGGGFSRDGRWLTVLSHADGAFLLTHVQTALVPETE